MNLPFSDLIHWYENDPDFWIGEIELENDRIEVTLQKLKTKYIVEIGGEYYSKSTKVSPAKLKEWLREHLVMCISKSMGKNYKEFMKLRRRDKKVLSSFAGAE